MTDLCCTCSSFRSCMHIKLKTNEVEVCEHYVPITTLSVKSYDDIHKTYNKWFFVSKRINYLIDLELAVYLANEEDGTPLWYMIRGASGDIKSEIANSFIGFPKVLEINELSTTSLISGTGDVIDVGRQIQNRHRIFVIRDLSALMSMQRDSKNELFGKLRTVYDGFLDRRLGNGVHKHYDGIVVSMIANSTHKIEEELVQAQSLGTRELTFDTGADKKDNVDKMKKAWGNEEQEVLMRKEIKDVTHGFLAHRKLQSIIIPEDVENELYKLANKLSILRANVPVDRWNGEVTQIPHPEVPSRLIKQLKRTYRGLMSLKDDYSSERALKIINIIVDSSGLSNRSKILSVFEKDKENAKVLKLACPNKFTVTEIVNAIKLGYKTTKLELECLWALGVLGKESITYRPEQEKNYVLTKYWLLEEQEEKIVQEKERVYNEI